MTCEEKWQIICPNCHKKFAKTKKRAACPHCNLAIEQMDDPTVLHYTYYSCINHKLRRNNCSQTFVKKEIIDAEIVDFLKRTQISPELVKWAAERLSKINKEEFQDQKTILHNLNKAVEKCQKEMQSLLKLKISPGNVNGDLLSEEEYLEQKQLIKQQRESYKEQIAALNTKEEKWIKLTEESFEFAHYAPYWFEKADYIEKTHILSKLGSNLSVKDKKLWIDGSPPWLIFQKTNEKLRILEKDFEPLKKTDSPYDFYR